MSQEQPTRKQDEAVKYGDVFPVSGELADRPVAPQDASMMQSAETRALGQTKKGGPASSMQASATRNEDAGFVGHADLTDVTGVEGVTVAEIDVPGSRVVTESVAGQIVGQYVEPTPVTETMGVEQRGVTIGEALEATARTAADKPVDESDAAAIQAAEVRARGTSAPPAGGLGAAAQAAASLNTQIGLEDEKVTLGDVLVDATARMEVDKVATVDDAERVMNAEVRNKPGFDTHPGGVADTVAAAAKFNEGA